MNEMTLKDIARLANCSTATVSRVINNEKGVSEETRAYIQRVIDENGYQPNKQANTAMACKVLRELLLALNV